MDDMGTLPMHHRLQYLGPVPLHQRAAYQGHGRSACKGLRAVDAHGRPEARCIKLCLKTLCGMCHRSFPHRWPDSCLVMLARLDRILTFGLSLCRDLILGPVHAGRVC